MLPGTEKNKFSEYCPANRWNGLLFWSGYHTANMNGIYLNFPDFKKAGSSQSLMTTQINEN
jgi:hypothetical protein